MSKDGKTYASLFTGGDGWGLGARAAGYRGIWGIECESAIADVAEMNGAVNVIRDFVQCVDAQELERPDLLCASPVCKSFSVANAEGKESDLDILCAHTVARFLRVLEPPYFVMENVGAYARSKSMDIIRQALQDVYGWWEEGVFNACEFGVPQSRKRFIVRANGGFVAPPRKAPRVIGWFEAIEDLIPTLPASAFAPWQEERLEGMEFWKTCCLVEGDAAGERSPSVLLPSEPAFTLKTSGGGRVHRAFLVDGKPASYEGELCVKDSCDAVPTVTASQEKHPFRAWLSQGRVVAMSIRALSRFQSFPDWYQFPEGKGTKSLCCTVIGNAVAPLMGQAMIESLG